MHDFEAEIALKSDKRRKADGNTVWPKAGWKDGRLDAGRLDAGQALAEQDSGALLCFDPSAATDRQITHRPVAPCSPSAALTGQLVRAQPEGSAPASSRHAAVSQQALPPQPALLSPGSAAVGLGNVQ